MMQSIQFRIGQKAEKQASKKEPSVLHEKLSNEGFKLLTRTIRI
jgi:hypothetical protein